MMIMSNDEIERMMQEREYFLKSKCSEERKMTADRVVEELILLRNLLHDMEKETRITISQCQLARFMRACELAAASVAYMKEHKKGVFDNER